MGTQQRLLFISVAYRVSDRAEAHFWAASVSASSTPICLPAVRRARWSTFRTRPFLRTPEFWCRRTQSRRQHIPVGYRLSQQARTIGWLLKRKRSKLKTMNWREVCDGFLHCPEQNTKPRLRSKLGKFIHIPSFHKMSRTRLRAFLNFK